MAKKPAAPKGSANAKKPTNGSPFAALADEVRARKQEAARALIQSKAQATKQALAATKSAATKSAAVETAAMSSATKSATTNQLVGSKATAKATPSAGVEPSAARVVPGDGGPLAAYPYDDRVAFHDAFGDVRPLGAAAPGGKAKKPKASGVHGSRAVAERAVRDAAEEAARQRLERLVVGGVSFEVRRDEHGVEAKRKGASDRTLLLLLRGELTPEARVDLHGLVRTDALRVVRQFLRDARARARLTVLIIHGKGAHSEGGIGVLEETCVEALTTGGSAPYVEAFATAPPKFGGRGAVLVRLRKK